MTPDEGTEDRIGGDYAPVHDFAAGVEALTAAMEGLRWAWDEGSDGRERLKAVSPLAAAAALELGEMVEGIGRGAALALETLRAKDPGGLPMPAMEAPGEMVDRILRERRERGGNG
jgi:hypothetical protein